MRLIKIASTLLMLAVFAGGASRALAFEHPEFFGGYVVVDDKLQELPPVKVQLKGFSLNKSTISAFTGLPTKLPAVTTFTPKLILYDQAVSVGGVHLSRLAPIPLGKTSKDGFAWAVTADVPVKVKPLEEAGMFYFAPGEHLSSGYYALYGGAMLGAEGVTTGSVFAFEVRHPQQDEIYGVITQFMEALRAKDADTAADLSVTISDTKSGTSPIIPVSSDLAADFKRPGFYTLGGEIVAAGIREGADTPNPGSVAYYCVDVNIYDALMTVTVNGKTLAGDSGKQMVVSEVQPGQFKVYTLKQFWMYSECK